MTGRGVPRRWLEPGCRFGAVDLPTGFGPLTFTATVRADRSVDLAAQGGLPAALDLPV